jgi:Apea-like HEPN
MELPCDMINPSFYHSSKNFVQYALELLEPRVNYGVVNLTPYSNLKRMRETDRDRIYRLQNPQQHFDFYTLIIKNSEVLRKSSEFLALDKVMHEDPVLSKYIDTFVSSGMSGGLMDTSNYIFFIVNELIIKYYLSGTVFDQALFDRLYCDLEHLFYKNEIPFKVVAPLHHFGSKLDVINLNEGLIIRKISPEERTIFARLAEGLGLAWVHMEEFEFGIEYQYKQKISTGFPPQLSWNATITNLLRKLILALRLFKAGSVGYTSTIWTPMLQTAVKGGGMYSPYPPEPTYGEKYEIDNEEASFFQDFWKTLVKKWNLPNTTGNKNLDLSLRRFESAYTRRSNDDKLIDFAIACEALLSKSNDRNSLTHKLSVRFSRLVENDYEKRKELCTNMKELYRERSKIVHGDPAPLENVEKIERFARIAINTYMDRFNNSSSQDDIIDRLDLG